MTGTRLAAGGKIDRGRPLKFRFNGRNLQGFAGDTLASALLANGVSLTARSFRYHRPRGIVSCGNDEPGTIVELIGSSAGANQPAPTVRLRDGLNARSVNCWPSPGLDLGAVNRALAPLLPAGFYYKTFFWPNWKFYEPLIRKMAGLAHAPAAPPAAGRFESRNWHCEALIAGAGPAGLAAALALAGRGAETVIVDRGGGAGGCLLNRKVEIDGLAGDEWAARMAAALADMPNVRFIRNAEAWAVREHNLVLVNEQDPADGDVIERNWSLRAGMLVSATGAGERMLVFSGNDRPGVMLASAVQTYLNRFAVRPGRRAVLFTNNDSAYEVAGDMLAAGVEIAAIVDTRCREPAVAPKFLADVQMLAGHEISGTRGRHRLQEVIAAPVAGRPGQRIACDLLAVSGGWDPSVRLWSQARGSLQYSEEFCAFHPVGQHRQMACAGGSAGIYSAAAAIADGTRAGNRVADTLGYPGRRRTPQTAKRPGYAIEPFWCGNSPERANTAFVDLLNDVTLADIQLALREGLNSVEHVKRYTTAGMGLNQGRTVGPNVAGIIAGALSQSPGEVGLTTFRSPVSPVSFGSIAGGRPGPAILPFRHTPITGWNVSQGAVMYEAGARWRRPGYFPLPGETMQVAVDRECRAVRNGAGVYDGSPLGTFAVKGVDAARLLDMLFINDFSDLAEGAGRYGILMTDDGRILDDGVGFRVGEHEYLLSVSTGNAPIVHRHISRFLAIDRPDWKVRLIDLTCQWMNATVCGPGAREILATLGTDFDISSEAFRFMELREGKVAGLPARVIRVSFTGSLSFEINVRSRDLLSLWIAIMDAGRRFGIAPVGSEANHVLRVEKGFLSIGHEVDGTADPYDLGFGWLMSRRQADFIGRRSVLLRRQSGRPRRELVGLLTDDADRLVTEGAPITPDGRRCASEGFVSASVWSVVRQRSVALALLENGRQRIGGQAWIRIADERIPARIVRPCFFDPEGKVLRS